MLLIVACQVATIAMLADKKADRKEILEMEKQTAILKNKAAALDLDTEQRRNNYYRALENMKFLED